MDFFSLILPFFFSFCHTYRFQITKLKITRDKEGRDAAFQIDYHINSGTKALKKRLSLCKKKEKERKKIVLFCFTSPLITC